jgi:Domain of unknown function (DUF4232)
VLRPAPPVPSMTGEHAVLYTLANRGPAACTVLGYPQVTLYDPRGRVLRFRYADGGGAYVTARKPVRVVLAPGAMAYVLAAKYRCDLGIAHNLPRSGWPCPRPAARYSAHASRSDYPARRACPTAAAGYATLASWSRSHPSKQPHRRPATRTDHGPKRRASFPPQTRRRHRQRTDSGMRVRGSDGVKNLAAVDERVFWLQ